MYVASTDYLSVFITLGRLWAVNGIRMYTMCWCTWPSCHTRWHFSRSSFLLWFHLFCRYMALKCGRVRCRIWFSNENITRGGIRWIVWPKIHQMRILLVSSLATVNLPIRRHSGCPYDPWYCFELSTWHLKLPMNFWRFDLYHIGWKVTCCHGNTYIFWIYWIKSKSSPDNSQTTCLLFSDYSRSI